ncbi:MAG: hypothetical protein AAF358_10625 [Pseudomonadota bacterium]
MKTCRCMVPGAPANADRKIGDSAKLLATLLTAGALWAGRPAAAQDVGPTQHVNDKSKAFEPFVPDAKTLALLDRSSTYLSQPGFDGRRRLVTNGGHQHVLMARVGPDGKIEMFCAASAHAAQTWGSAPRLPEQER